MNEISDFIEYYNEQIFIGSELEGQDAAAHYLNLCSEVSNRLGPKCPYLLQPLRLHVMHLEHIGQYAKALGVLKTYQAVLAEHLYIDDEFRTISGSICVRLIAGLENDSRADQKTADPDN